MRELLKELVSTYKELTLSEKAYTIGIPFVVILMPIIALNLLRYFY